MTKYNPKNERIKRDYFRFQTEAKQKAQSTLKGIRKALDRFEQYNAYKDFGTFNKEQAIAFKKHLGQQKSKQSGEPLSKSCVLSTTNHLKEFFQWIAWQPGYKSKIHPPDIEYFNLSDKEISIAKSAKIKDFPTLEQIRKVIFQMPTNSDVQRRDRAIIAFTILTGMRDSAIASIRIKHVHLSKDPIMVTQDPDQVNTKFSKQIISHFFPVGDDIKNIFVDWLTELKEQKHYSQNNPVFPRTKVSIDENQSFKADGLESICWSTATPIRDIFKRAFTESGLPYFSPHRFRDTLVHVGQEWCRSPEEFKAWSQSLGHSSPLTTFTSYGSIDPHQQGKILQRLGPIKIGSKDEELIERIRGLVLPK
jgi:integrase